MSSPRLLRQGTWIPALLVCTVTSITDSRQYRAAAQETPAQVAAAPASDAASNIRISFASAPWREVINWLAEEGGLALHVGDLPTGSFTYTDPGTFTLQGAIDRVNLFLLPQGFTLVRSGQLLTVINLSDPRSMQQLDAIAKTVTVDELPNQQTHDVVKCIFPLRELEAEEAVQELAALKLMTTPAVFSKTNQLMITDTAGKLLDVKRILDSFQPSAMDNGTIVKSFAMKHVNAEDVLVVARPHLGLATGEMIGIDVSLSSDVEGKNIYVTGIEDKVALIERLVTAIDQPKVGGFGNAEMKLRSHLVEGGNVEIVYNVLQTLLAGKEIRLSMDEAASSVVALAPDSIQAEIEKTVAELQATDADFEVIPLKNVDPFFVITLLEELLDLPDPFDDPEDVDPNAPKIDADPGSMRLFVRAKKHQIEQIKKIVAGLDSAGTVGSSELIRVLPFKGKQAESLVETAVKFWRGENPVILYRSSEAMEPVATERVVNGPRPITPRANRLLSSNDLRDQRWLTSKNNASSPAIRCQVTARGLLVQSDDASALDQFEQHIRTIAGPIDASASPPIVFYLRYTKPDDALRMLAELLDGADSVSDAEVGTLVNGFVSSSSSTYLGSIVTSRDGTTTMMAGTITVVADSRLNRLIAQGTTQDIELIESYLKIIDKDSSITKIETYGTSHVIELINSRASEVAESIRQAFAGRISGEATAGRANPQGGGGSQEAQRAAAAAAAKNTDSEKVAKGKDNGGDNKKATQRGGAASRPARDLEPKMTIAVHEPSNSLIVTAPEQLFREVEKLALSIDSRGAQQVEVVAPMNAQLMEMVLQQVLLGEGGGGTATRAPSSGAGSPQRSSAPPTSSARAKNNR